MMKKLTSAVLLLGVCFPMSFGGQKVGLPERYKKWLEEDVVYIIASHERDVFLQLQSDRERDIFIEAFWKQRDPTPGTPRNEFKEEHYRRLEYANTFYGRSSPVPGWKTDRGRMYIILGAPRTIEQYDSVNGVYPTEIWFYMGDPALGLPTGFNLIFFKRNGTGNYVLYSPTNDGPQSLIADSMNNYQDDQAAYKALQKLSPNLAVQTLSLIPAEHNPPGMESLASIQLIANVFASPQKKVEVDYADAILKYKDFVEVEYTANYIPSEACFQVIQDASGTSLVHYAIEPAKISVEEAGGAYEASFQLTGRVSDAQGRTIYQFDKDFRFNLTAAELDEVRAKSISLQDSFPLVPGAYNLDILLKNTLSKEFSGAARKLTVPGDAATAPWMSPLLLAYQAEKKQAAANERVPFKIGDEQILCQGRKSYGQKDTLVLFLQVLGLTGDFRSSGTFLFTYFKEDREFLTKKNKVAEYGPGPGVIEIQPLKDFPPGYYQAKVALIDGQGRELAAQKENFEVSLAPAVPRPLVISKVVSSVKREDDLYVTGVQYMNAGDLGAAQTRLAEAYASSPGRPEFALAYGQLLYRLNEFKRAKDILLPLAGGQEPPAEALALLGQACQTLGQYQEAVTHYAAYLTRYGMNIDILNYLGTCYFQLGNKDEALKAWTKSLELSPNQERIRQLLDSIKLKK
jgi:GWxTD domain-containing protein